MIRRLRRDDRGTNLVELSVGMGLMAVFMAMFTGAVLLMTNSSNKTEALSTAEQQANQAYLWLDKTVRYASAITAPGQSSTGNWYVELSVPGMNGTATCYQLRVDKTAGHLQQRSWTVSATGTAAAATSWRALASGITNGTAAAGSATVPFALTTTANSDNQQLQIDVIATQTTPSTGTATTKVTFTALNSISDYGAGAPVVCSQQGARP